MSVVTLDEAKRYLQVIHAYDDARIQDLIDDAEGQCADYVDLDGSLPRIGQTCPSECDTSNPSPVSDGSELPKAVRRGILYVVQAAYEGKGPDEVEKITAIAQRLWHPWRCRLGV